MVVMMEVKKRGKESPKGEKRVSFQENKEALNYKGATREAWARPLLPIYKVSKDRWKGRK